MTFVEGLTMATKVGPKGQVVIERAIRETLGVVPGSIALQRIVGERVEIQFLPPEHAESLLGILAPYVSISVSDAELEAAIEDASSAAAAERHERAARG